LKTKQNKDAGVYFGDFGTIAAASIALNLRGKFSDCGLKTSAPLA
jgi:hypothetical protein